MQSIIKTKVIELPTFEQLTPQEQAKVLTKYYDINTNYDWFDSVYEDAKEVASFMGIEIDKIYFSGFYSQGDGACFEGRFSYKKGCVKAIKNHAPLDKTLHSIADDWQAIQKKANYKLEGTIQHQGHYYHENCTNIIAIIPNKYVFDTDDSYVNNNNEIGAEATRILRRLMKWIYKQLNDDYDYLTTDEAIRESLITNEYTFNRETLEIDS